jgi:SAM-dependent methyltransferase
MPMEFVCCAICEGYNTMPLFSKWGYTIVECRTCGLSYVNPRNFAVEDDSYFRGAYLSTIEEQGSLNPGIKALYSQILGDLETYLRPSRLLDVGCAMGHFMVEARNRGWDVSGVECSPYASEYGRNRWGLAVRQACNLSDAALSANQFDACVLIEVAEHLPHPKATFSEVFRVLKPGGILYVTTPNFASFRSLLQREEWKPVIPSGHLYYFTADSLMKLLTGIGYADPIDLSLPARLEDEVEAITTAGGSISWRADVEAIRERTGKEDRVKASNGRGEGLTVCARKPQLPHETSLAALRFTGVPPSLEGKLVSVHGDSAEDQKVYFVSGGRKHWVVTTDWLAKRGMRLEDTIEVDGTVLASFLLGPPLQ